MNETMVTVTGNVAGDVVGRRVGPNAEHLLVTFRVASSERRWDKSTESWIDGDRFTASVNCWRRVAEGVGGTLVKGDPVVVVGRLSVREYEADGVRRYMTEIAATAVGPDLSRCSAEVRRRRAVESEAGVTDEAGVVGVVDVTGLPEVDATGDGTVREGDDRTAAAESATGTADDGSDGPRTAAAGASDGGSEGATVTGIGAGDRRRSAASRASA
ncbi:single-stranded DNA-binding protein [Actinomycetospora sp. NBRC 106375]|uniref:single-stranded DNA-binding protein n=1 Tax=Actinomycetospora sp. NBRC 106375 TaxID=3032207 RepID=UPI00255239C1|nr:single-stranded DNA-binding protein [Actinomycetospora sp. NBRC 106375]